MRTLSFLLYGAYVFKYIAIIGRIEYAVSKDICYQNETRRSCDGYGKLLVAAGVSRCHPASFFTS